MSIVLVQLIATPAGAQHQHAPARRDSIVRRDSTMPRPDTMRARAPDGGHNMAAMMIGPLGISVLRMGSGTSWLPDSSPMHANHKMWGDWTIMLHGVAFGVYDHQGTERGADQVGIVDWEMLMAMRRIGTGLLHLQGMASLEPATIGARGYPLLLQTGESYKGRPLVDRQHPHDLFMELAALFQQPVARDLALSFYGAVVGEPALGPVAFMHRPSAQSDPFSPLGHHWQDATHISYGVATGGVYTRRWQLEGSVFNGREPDENRWNFDFGPLDSYSGRLTVNPSGRWSLAGWYGFLKSPEELHPDESTHRYGTSVLYSGRGWRNGEWASFLMWAANEHGGHAENSAIAESNLEIGRHNAVFGRYEYVRKNAEDLVVPGAPPTQEYGIHSIVAGYIREVASIPGGTIGVGFRGSVNLIPKSLGAAYGTRTPAGVAIYARVRPKRMTMDATMAAMPNMPGHNKAPGHEMPSARDTAHMMAPRDSMPGMRHDSMPGMQMRHDSIPGMRDSSSRKAQRTVHEMTMPTDSVTARRDSTAMKMPGMKMTRQKASPPKKTPVSRNKTAPRKAKTPSKKPTTRATKPPPGHEAHMPGMKMPSDTTKKPKP